MPTRLWSRRTHTAATPTLVATVTTALAVSALTIGLAPGAAQAGQSGKPGPKPPVSQPQKAVPNPDKAQLTGFASLPADTFVPGSEPSGFFTTNAGVPFPGQPVQGFSAIHAIGDGSYLVMSDNGFGAKANSPDFQLRVHRVRPDFASRTIAVQPGGFVLSDPDHLVPFPIWRDGDCQAQATRPTGYTCPAPDRVLTGWDFDIESMQVAPDGTIWFGEEFGPFLLHTDARGKLLDAPVPTPGVKSPSNPTLAPGEVPNLGGSKGFEGLAISPNGRFLYPVLEGPVAEDTAAGRTSDLRIFEVLRGNGRRPAAYTGTTWRYKLEAPSNAIGDFIAINNHQFLMIERDNGSGPTAQFKRVYLVDSRDKNKDGYVDKSLLVDLLAVPDPRNLGGYGRTFALPYVTIEDVEILDDQTIAVLNDNNYPATGGRGADVKDVNEFLRIKLDRPLAVDPRLLPGA